MGNKNQTRSRSAPQGQSTLAAFLLLFLSIVSTVACTRFEPSYEGFGYLLIAPEVLMPVTADLASYKDSQGFVVDSVTLEQILTTTPGDDGPEKIQNFLKGYATTTPEREFVLLVGSMDVMPMRVAHTDPDDHDKSVPTDFYYEALGATWDADGDGFYGEYVEDMEPGTENYEAELYVGRIPWDDTEQVQDIIDTILLYEKDESARKTRVLAAAATIEESCDSAVPIELGKRFVVGPAGYDMVTLYEDCPVLNPDFELTQDDFLGQWELLNPGFVFMNSHGSGYGGWYDDFWKYFIHVDALPQGVQPSMVVAAGCHLGCPDLEDPSLGEVLMREGISAAFLGGSRATDQGSDPVPMILGMARATTSLLWEGRTLAESKIHYIEAYARRARIPQAVSGPKYHRNLFQFMLYGDPSIQFR